MHFTPLPVIQKIHPGGTSRMIPLKIACSRSDCARSRAYFSRYFMVISLRSRQKHVSTHARNRENVYSTADYHLKWFSLESEADEAAVSEEGSSSNLYSCEDGESSVSESGRRSREIDYDESRCSSSIHGANCTQANLLANARRDLATLSLQRDCELARAMFWCDYVAKPRDYT